MVKSLGKGLQGAVRCSRKCTCDYCVGNVEDWSCRWVFRGRPFPAWTEMLGSVLRVDYRFKFSRGLVAASLLWA